MNTEQTIPKTTLPVEDNDGQLGDGLSPFRVSWPEYLTTKEAATYLRKSVSWLTRQPDIPYLRGIPNTYKRSDLDDWFERHKFVPEVA